MVKAKPKPRMGGMGGMAIGLGGTGLVLASTLGTQAISAGRDVGMAAIAADAAKDIFKNPMAIAAVAGVALILLLK
jgi:hypothetical protein